MTAPRKTPGAARWEAEASRWVKHLGEFTTARTARDAVQQGNHLLLLKAASPHGTWRNLVNTLGLSVSVAERLMAMSRRFADAPTSFFGAVGSAGKMIELLPLQGAEELAHGAEIHGLTLERIKPMTVLQLRAAVRAACVAMGRAPSPPPKPVHLTADEERMLRLFRQCSAPAREALFSVAGLLAQP